MAYIIDGPIKSKDLEERTVYCWAEFLVRDSFPDPDEFQSIMDMVETKPMSMDDLAQTLANLTKCSVELRKAKSPRVKRLPEGRSEEGRGEPCEPLLG